jgi:hypothetical protein
VEENQGALTHLGHRFEQPQEKLLTGLGYAARLFPPIGDSLKSKRPTELAVDTGGAYTFLRETAPILEGAGFGILVPPWWNKKGARLGVKVKMKSQKDNVAPGRMALENLINYQWQLSVGETALTEEEFRALAKLKSPLVQIRGQWVSLDAEQIDAAIKFWEKQNLEGEMDLLEAMRMGLGGENSAGGLPIEDVETDGWLSEWLEKFSQSEKAGRIAPARRPEGPTASVPAIWLLVAGLFAPLGIGRLPGGRHGIRKNHPDNLTPGPRERTGREVILSGVVDSADIGGHQLGAGDWQIRARVADLCPSRREQAQG